MHSFLKFSYFFVLLMAFSCKETSTGTKNTTNESVVTEAPSEKESDVKTILFFGNSLTAGYGLETEESFPSLIQDKLDSLHLNYEVINAGLSGETTAGGKNRLEWVLNQKVDVFVLELGANDGLRGVPLTETRSNLQQIINMVWEKNKDTKIVLAGMMIPPNMGQNYTTEFRTIFPELAQQNNIELIPFLLEGVAGIPELNLEDGIHPTAEGQKIVANNVWAVLESLL